MSKRYLLSGEVSFYFSGYPVETEEDEDLDNVVESLRGELTVYDLAGFMDDEEIVEINELKEASREGEEEEEG